MKVAILAPWRPGSPDRQKLWDFSRTRWEQINPDWTIYEAPGPIDGPFNRSAAINQAAALAGDWDVALIIDCDVIANPQAVRYGVELAHSAGQMVVTHDERVMLSKEGTPKVLAGETGSWRAPGMVERIWHDSVSCSVAVARPLWDRIGGFDELFIGWGYEDSAFRIAAETLLGTPLIRLSSELFHLWHPLSPETNKRSPTLAANRVRMDRYLEARWNTDAVQALISEATAPLPETRIPRILHRTVPADTSDEVEGWWAKFQALHPGWTFHTHREPLDPALWPLTGDLWGKCQNGAQKAGLIRLEALVTHGGVYVDSDVEPFRSLEPLLQVEAFAGWEDEAVVPDAVLGAIPEHPAFVSMLTKARAAVESGADAWTSGPGVTTSTLPGRRDVLLLPPGSFYPHHYLEKVKAGTRTGSPWVFAEHKWAHSWGDARSKRTIAQKQRR